ncbi:MAG: NADH-quinone oxidoreductase subunit M [Cyanobacteria bacterium P01_F01_bin.33]
MLSALIWIPILGAIWLGVWPQEISRERARWASLAIASALFVWSLVLAVQFDAAAPGLQFQENIAWIPPLGLNYVLGVDGLSMPLVVLNGLLTGIAVYATPPSVKRYRFYFSLLLLLNASVIGAFLTQNLMLFFIFYELELLPMYLLIAIWGGKRRVYAATKFLIYTAFSGILLLLGFLGTAWLSHSESFDLAAIDSSAVPHSLQVALLIILVIGFGIKIPIVPFHTWLPDAHVEASTPISVLLAGVLLKLGTYGLLRFGLQLLPDVWADLAPWLAWIGAFSVIYGAVIAITQNDMKKMVAYSSVAHMGYIILAAAAARPLSLLGATFQMVSHGLISAMLFLVVGVIYAKTGTRDLRILGGLFNPERGLPLIGSLMVLAAMASAGIPGMSGFIAEFVVFRGSYPVFTVPTLIAMVGTALTSVYFLILLDRAFFGRLPSDDSVQLPRVQWSDRIPAIVLALIIVALGLEPNWLARRIEPTTTALTPRPQIVAIAPVSPPASLELTAIALNPPLK